MTQKALRTTTKRDLARAVAQDLGCPASQALELVDALFTELREQLLEGNRIEVRGFGVLDVKDTAAKPQARNPRTGEAVLVPPRRKVMFKPGKMLKEAMHEPIARGEEG